MRLYINGKEAKFSSEFDVNMSFKFLDTYNPSAIKTSYSKTVTLPDCKENAEIFGDFKVKYFFELHNDDGRIIERGYCILDNVKTVGLEKSYNLTLYGGLGDFFYNLKGDDSNPKSLADLYWGDISGMSKAFEDIGTFITWNLDYVHQSWFDPQGMSDTFRGVPCIYDDRVMDKEKTIIPAEEGGLFPERSIDGSGSAFLGRDGTRAIMVQADENTCYAKQDFRVDLMPLGIKYKSIIEACCNPENNGGYEVTLDPTFFNDSNPYWTNMFVLKGLPSLDYDYQIATGSYQNFSSSLGRAGNYRVSNVSSAPVILEPQEDKAPWKVVNGDTLEVNSDYGVVGINIKYNITPFIEIDPNDFPDSATQRHLAYITKLHNLSLQLQAINTFTGDVQILVNKSYPPMTQFPILHDPNSTNTENTIVPSLYVGEAMEGIATIPEDWTSFKLRLVVTCGLPTTGFELHYKTRVAGVPVWRSKIVQGDFVAPSSRDYQNTNFQAVKALWEAMGLVWTLYLPESTVEVVSEYLADIDSFEEFNFTKKDLLSGTSTPFDYLTWFTKMFNLRFYLQPGTKKVSILRADNFIRAIEPLNIEKSICYDKEYTRTRKIIDEEYLKFNLTPAKNATVEAYAENVDNNLLDKLYPVQEIGGTGKEKEYLNIGLKIGSKGRNSTAFSLRGPLNGKYYYGFNQGNPYTVSYVKDANLERYYITDEDGLNYEQGLQRYDFLTVDEDILNTVVMYSGLRSTPFGTPAALTRTSVDMLRFAGKPCWISGWGDNNGQLLGANYIPVSQIPHYGLVPSVNNFESGISYSNVDYESLIVVGNIYDIYLKDFIDRIYSNPLVVECYARLSSPELRRLYWFDNNYWILTEISNYNYRDEPVKCKFIRYRYDA